MNPQGMYIPSSGSAIPLNSSASLPTPTPSAGGSGPVAGATDPTGSVATSGGSSQPSWWQKLLPTAGGILGGVLGGAADVGSLGLLAPLINPITGAAAGGALGQMGENALTGQKVLQGNDLSSGLENGAGALVGEVGGKVINALGEGISGAAAKASGDIADKAAMAAENAGKLTDAKATQLNYGGISGKLANDLQLGKGQQFVRSMGFDATNPYDMQKVAQGVGDLNNVYDRALSTAQPVKTEGLEQFFNNTAKDVKAPATEGGMSANDIALLKRQGYSDEAIAKMTATGNNATPGSSLYANLDPNSPVGQALAEFNKAKGLAPNAELPAEMNAVDMRKLQQAVGRQVGNTQTLINNAELNGTYNAEAQAHLSKLSDLYGALGDKIKTPEVNDTIAGFQVTDADRHGLVAKYGDKLGNYLADTIGNAKNADDLLGPMQDFTRMGRASRMAINDIENVTNSPRAFAREEFKANGGILPSKASTATGTAGQTIENAAKAIHSPTGAVIAAGRKLHAAGFTPKIANAIGDVLTRTAPLMTPAATAVSNIPNIAGNGGVPSSIPAVTGGQEGGQPMNPGAATPPANPVNSVLENVLRSLSQPGASLTPGYGSMVTAADTLAPAAQNNILTANTLKTLAPTYANAGGPQGLGGGVLNAVLSHIPGTAAYTYAQEQQAAAAQIAKTLGIPMQQALAMLPQVAQNPNVAAPQQAGVGSLIGQLTSGLPAQ